MWLLNGTITQKWKMLWQTFNTVFLNFEICKIMHQHTGHLMVRHLLPGGSNFIRQSVWKLRYISNCFAEYRSWPSLTYCVTRKHTESRNMKIWRWVLSPFHSFLLDAGHRKGGLVGGKERRKQGWGEGMKAIRRREKRSVRRGIHGEMRCPLQVLLVFSTMKPDPDNLALFSGKGFLGKEGKWREGQIKVGGKERKVTQALLDCPGGNLEWRAPEWHA